MTGVLAPFSYLVYYSFHKAGLHHGDYHKKIISMFNKAPA